MRRISKIVVAFGIVVLISILFDMKVSSAATEEQFLAPPTEDETFPEDLNEVIKINPVNSLANSYLKNGKVSIGSTGNVITVTGETNSFSSVSSITLNLYLQRWDPTRRTWITIVNIGGFTNSNSSSVKATKKINTSSGYYYRARAHHRISHNGTVEQAYSNTSSIYLE